MNHWTIATMQDCYCIRLLTKHSLLLAVSNCSYTRDTNLWTFATIFTLTRSQSSPDLTQASANHVPDQFFETLPQSRAILHSLAHEPFILTIEVNWSSYTYMPSEDWKFSQHWLFSSKKLLNSFFFLKSFTSKSPSSIIIVCHIKPFHHFIILPYIDLIPSFSMCIVVLVFQVMVIGSAKKKKESPPKKLKYYY